jgi:hypothetical protein
MLSGKYPIQGFWTEPGLRTCRLYRFSPLGDLIRSIVFLPPKDTNRPVMRRASPLKGVYVGSLIHLAHLKRAYPRVGPSSPKPPVPRDPRMRRLEPSSLPNPARDLAGESIVCTRRLFASSLHCFGSHPQVSTLSRFHNFDLISLLPEQVPIQFTSTSSVRFPSLLLYSQLWLDGWSSGFGPQSNEGLP